MGVVLGGCEFPRGGRVRAAEARGHPRVRLPAAALRAHRGGQGTRAGADAAQEGHSPPPLQNRTVQYRTVLYCTVLYVTVLCCIFAASWSARAASTPLTAIPTGWMVGFACRSLLAFLIFLSLYAPVFWVRVQVAELDALRAERKVKRWRQPQGGKGAVVATETPPTEARGSQVGARTRTWPCLWRRSRGSNSIPQGQLKRNKCTSELVL